MFYQTDTDKNKELFIYSIKNNNLNKYDLPCGISNICCAEHFAFLSSKDIDGITSRAMMGEYLLYCDGKLFGGVYDNRFLVKPTKSAVKLMPQAQSELPYEGAKPMLLVDNIEDKDFLKKLVETMSADLLQPKKRK